MRLYMVLPCFRRLPTLCQSWRLIVPKLATPYTRMRSDSCCAAPASGRCSVSFWTENFAPPCCAAPALSEWDVSFVGENFAPPISW